MERIAGEVSDIKGSEYQFHCVAFVRRLKRYIAVKVRSIITLCATVVEEHKAVLTDNDRTVIAGSKVQYVLDKATAFGVAVGYSRNVAAESNRSECGIDGGVNRSVVFDVRCNNKVIVILSEFSRSREGERYISSRVCLR